MRDLEVQRRSQAARRSSRRSRPLLIVAMLLLVVFLLLLLIVIDLLDVDLVVASSRFLWRSRVAASAFWRYLQRSGGRFSLYGRIRAVRRSANGARCL